MVRGARGLARDAGDPLRYPCPVCGAGQDDACEPLRTTGFPSVLRPHRERGAMPWLLERRGYTELPGGLWRRPAGRSSR